MGLDSIIKSRRGTFPTAYKVPCESATAEVYRRLNVHPNAVIQFPKLMQQVKAAGGRRKVIEYLRASSSPHARRFIHRFDDITLPAVVRSRAPLEAFCVAAEVSPEQFLSAIAQSAREINQLAGAVTAAEAHPRIVEVSSALAAAGDLDHMMLNMKHMGFLPSPKGSQVNVNVNANAHAQSASQAATVAAPSPEHTIRGLVDRFNTARLAANPVAALPEHGVTDGLPERIPEREPVTIDANYAREGESERED